MNLVPMIYEQDICVRDPNNTIKKNPVALIDVLLPTEEQLLEEREVISEEVDDMCDDHNGTESQEDEQMARGKFKDWFKKVNWKKVIATIVDTAKKIIPLIVEVVQVLPKSRAAIEFDTNIDTLLDNLNSAEPPSPPSGDPSIPDILKVLSWLKVPLAEPQYPVFFNNVNPDQTAASLAVVYKLIWEYINALKPIFAALLNGITNKVSLDNFFYFQNSEEQMLKQLLQLVNALTRMVKNLTLAVQELQDNGGSDGSTNESSGSSLEKLKPINQDLCYSDGDKKASIPFDGLIIQGELDLIVLANNVETHMYVLIENGKVVYGEVDGRDVRSKGRQNFEVVGNERFMRQGNHLIFTLDWTNIKINEEKSLYGRKDQTLTVQVNGISYPLIQNSPVYDEYLKEKLTYNCDYINNLEKRIRMLEIELGHKDQIENNAPAILFSTKCVATEKSKGYSKYDALVKNGFADFSSEVQKQVESSGRMSVRSIGETEPEIERYNIFLTIVDSKITTANAISKDGSKSFNCQNTFKVDGNKIVWTKGVEGDPFAGYALLSFVPTNYDIRGNKFTTYEDLTPGTIKNNGKDGVEIPLGGKIKAGYMNLTCKFGEEVHALEVIIDDNKILRAIDTSGGVKEDFTDKLEVKDGTSLLLGAPVINDKNQEWDSVKVDNGNTKLWGLTDFEEENPYEPQEYVALIAEVG